MAATRETLLAAIDSTLVAGDLWSKLTEVKIDDTIVALLKWGRSSDLFLNLLLKRFGATPAGAGAALATDEEAKEMLRQFVKDEHVAAPEGAAAKFGDGVLLGKLLEKLPALISLIQLLMGSFKPPVPA